MGAGIIYWYFSKDKKTEVATERTTMLKSAVIPWAFVGNTSPNSSSSVSSPAPAPVNSPVVSDSSSQTGGYVRDSGAGLDQNNGNTSPKGKQAAYFSESKPSHSCFLYEK